MLGPEPPGLGEGTGVLALTPTGPHDLGVLIEQTRRLLSSARARALADHGASVASWLALSSLRNCGPMTQSSLAARTGMTAARISRLITSLEADGFVRRGRDRVDRRQMLVAITGRARRKLVTMGPVVEVAEVLLFDRLSPVERMDLGQLLKKLLRPS